MKLDSLTTMPSERRTWRGRIKLAVLLFFCAPLFAVHRIAFALDGILFPQLRRAKEFDAIFIVGMPRSGTTLAHRLITAQRDRFTAMPLWELLFAPALCQKRLFLRLHHLDSLFGSFVTRAVEGLVERMAAQTKHIHSTGLFEAEEDQIGLMPFDGCFLRVIPFPKSDYSWQLGQFATRLPDGQRRYLLDAYLGLIRRHLAFRGSERIYVSKTPGFLTWIPLLKQSIPSARFVFTQRDAARCVASQLSSVESEIRSFGFDLRSPQILDPFLDLLTHYQHIVETSVEHFRSAPSQQAFVLPYKQLTRSPHRAIQAMLRHFEIECTLSDSKRLADAAITNSRYRSKHHYSMSDYPIPAERLEKLFKTNPEPATNLSRTPSLRLNEGNEPNEFLSPLSGPNRKV
ncbi:MAG: sulfotransferase family protein [Aureliella sp.]